MSSNPVSTYRIQFHKDFTFHDLEKVIPYLRKLGIKTLYASPVFKSTSGSTHGYDVLDPHVINPEVGTEEQLRELSRSLKELGIGWLQDIVPNHMAFSPHNPWLMDLLEKGPQSTYAPFFDTALSSELYRGRMMVPFLGSPLDEVIEKGELKVDYQEGRLVFNYYDNYYPLNPRSYEEILNNSDEQPSEGLSQVLSQMHQIHQIEDATQYTDRWNEFLLQLSAFMKNDATAGYIKKCIENINNDKDRLSQLAEEQIYRLCSWQETDQQITFRRFFTVNGLICLNIQDEQVFDTYHQFIKALLKEGVINGLRVDHVDGLFDPSGYLDKLRELAGDDTYIVVEKILEPGEQIPQHWPIQGNTGYDFLSLVNNVFTAKESETAFSEFYSTLVSEDAEVQEQIYTKKAYILHQHMAGELENLHRLLLNSDLLDSKSAALIKDGDLKSAIGELLIQCPIYRYYGNSFPLSKTEEGALKTILERIRKEKPELRAAVGVLEDILIKKPRNGDDEYNDRALYFYQRCMQFTGPLMAKGVEDTLMYTYNRFIAHNEVGDSPEAFGMSSDEFHGKMQERQENFPLSLNATSTHDTKRGEDVRARLNVLSDVPAEWLQKTGEWFELNRGLKEGEGPDENDEYLIYQTLIGSYPMPGQSEDEFKERIQNYIEKALREAKQNSNWTSPNAPYEEATKKFAVQLLDKTSSFWKSFAPFHKKIADLGVINSLAQLILKFMCPGVPDVYQGCELWDLSMVDPDNRRAVDYKLRTKLLEEVENSEHQQGFTSWLWEKRYEGHPKLWLTQLLLKERRANYEVFAKGEYIPLKVKGKYKDNIFAFARRHQQSLYVTMVPLHVARMLGKEDLEIAGIDWKNTRVILPQLASQDWTHLLRKGVTGTSNEEILINDVFGDLPFAVIKFEQKSSGRAAGILMHITSLPSSFGIGDFGPGAKSFADFLASSGQKFWQLLPLSPTEQGSGNSPYSSYSSMAGNPLLISPELLVQNGLLGRKKQRRWLFR
ncbi:malto-oligosyltrehalose synthase [Arcticibacter sp. MXS-1]|uniref:malto-oligosyltrehalose synthase n=1 Tax=Arcticibacter sp. MXS-1 TaxID=3341726 RepID=UPI0035A8E879